MKIFRFFLLILYIFAFPTFVASGIYFFKFFHTFPHYTLFVGIFLIIEIIIILLSLFFLNKKAKIVGMGMGVILSIIVGIAGFFIKSENNFENFSKNSETTTTENTTPQGVEGFFDRLFPISEKGLKVDTSIAHMPKYLDAESCKELGEISTNLDKNFVNFLHNNSKNTEIKGKSDIFRKSILFFEIIEIQRKQNLIFNTYGKQITKDSTIETLLSKEDLETYQDFQKQIDEKFLQIKNLQKSGDQIEKTLILNAEYIAEYEKYLKIIEKVIAKNNGKIYCKKDSGEYGRLEVVRSLGNYIQTSALFENNYLIDKSIILLENFLKNHEQKYLPQDLYHPALVNIVINNSLEQIALGTIYNSTELGIPTEKWSEMKKFFEKNNLYTDLLLAIKQEYWYVNIHIDEAIKQGDEMVTKSGFNREELQLALKHFFLEKAQRLDTENTYEKTIFSGIDNWEDELISYLDAYTDDKLGIVTKKNFASRVLFYVLIPTLGGYEERMLATEFLEKITLNKIP